MAVASLRQALLPFTCRSPTLLPPTRSRAEKTTGKIENEAALRATIAAIANSIT